MTLPPDSDLRRAVVIGGGPAGLMAAEALAQAGVATELFDAMPSVGRKFLLAGKGGLNLTHSEPPDRFVDRYGTRRAEVERWLHAFGPAALRAWANDLGIETFVGSSGRVFPAAMKAAPLLRAWLHRLRGAGVRFHMRHRWLGWDSAGKLRFDGPTGDVSVPAEVVVLALGGASWPQLGGDGGWVPLLGEHGVGIAALRPANCGFDVARAGPDGEPLPGWSEFFRSRFAGQPLKTVALACDAVDGTRFHQRGEFIVTDGGVEGSLVYAASSILRDTIAAHGQAEMHIDLLPDRSAEFVHSEVARPRGSRSLATHLKSRLGIDGVKAALLHELLPRERLADPAALATALKALPLRLVAPRPIAEAISTAGGVAFDSLDADLMLSRLPGVFCAGEMLDWEAPTGGYLLTACLASGRWAGAAAARHLARHAAYATGT